VKILKELRSEPHEFPLTIDGMAVFEETLRLRGIAQCPAFGGEALDDDDPNTCDALRQIKDADTNRLIEYVDRQAGDMRLAAVEALGAHDEDDEDDESMEDEP
jgi:hypothetical protein